MTLAECRERVSYREYRLWMAHFALAWNEPDRHDWYLMQVACEVRRGWVSTPNQVRVTDFKMPFTPAEPEPPPGPGPGPEGGEDRWESWRAQADVAKGAWFARLANPGG